MSLSESIHEHQNIILFIITFMLILGGVKLSLSQTSNIHNNSYLTYLDYVILFACSFIGFVVFYKIALLLTMLIISDNKYYSIIILCVFAMLSMCIYFLQYFIFYLMKQNGIHDSVYMSISVIVIILSIVFTYFIE